MLYVRIGHLREHVSLDRHARVGGEGRMLDLNVNLYINEVIKCQSENFKSELLHGLVCHIQ